MVVIMKTYPEYKEHWENCCVEDLDHVETDVQCIICLSLAVFRLKFSGQGGKYSK